jgi:hypothetical protein
MTKRHGNGLSGFYMSTCRLCFDKISETEHGVSGQRDKIMFVL